MHIPVPFSGLSADKSSQIEQSKVYGSLTRPKNKIPAFLEAWIVVSVIVFSAALALAVEIALLFSSKTSGFSTGHIDTEQVQWWSGFLPTLAIGPLVWIWRIVDNDVKRMQPYVTMSQGPTKPEESVLLDLEHENLFKLFLISIRNGQYLIIGSSLICILNVLLHPMAGSFFLVKPGINTNPLSAPIHGTASLGLNPSYKDITSFVAAAGFAEAAAFHNLSDPPFIRGSWAVAQFKSPLDITRNSTLSVNTTGVLTNVSCSAPTSTSLTPPSSSTSSNWTLKAALDGCSVTQSIDSSSATTQYGVEPEPSCQSAGSTQVENPFAPVFFWFFDVPQNGGTPVASAVFCKPTIGAYAVAATVDTTTGLLVDVTVTGNIDTSSNNVTGGNFAGKAFNGVSFDTSSDFNLTDSFVRARALATQSGVPGAIFRIASDPNQDGGLDTVFSNTTGFLGITTKVYTQYLSLVALANYFTPTDSLLKAEITTWPNRLWINPRTAHLLAVLLVLVAALGTIIHISHRRQRQRLYLASCPGSMAHYMSVLSHVQSDRNDRDVAPVAEGADLVGPLDSEKTMEEKLKGVRFMLDSNSGNIVAVPFNDDQLADQRRVSSVRRERSNVQEGEGYELDGSRQSLLSLTTAEGYKDPFDHKKHDGSP